LYDNFAYAPIGLDSDQLNWGPEEDDDIPVIHTEPTIAEDSLAEAEEGDEDISATPTLKRRSYRLSTISDDKRISLGSLKLSDSRGTASNRSSATIKPVNGSNGHKSLGDFDFDDALRKFASERDTFLSDLNTSAGVVPKQPKPRPRTQRIVSDDAPSLKSGLGSVRRRISFREMNSMKRQPSVVRQCIPLFFLLLFWVG
jgi:hypothetical protein